MDISDYLTIMRPLVNPHRQNCNDRTFANVDLPAAGDPARTTISCCPATTLAVLGDAITSFWFRRVRGSKSGSEKSGGGMPWKNSSGT